MLGFGKKDDKEESKTSNTGSKIVGGLLGGIILLTTIPAALILFAIFAVIGEQRLIRRSRWNAATGIAFVISLAIAGFSLGRWFSWFLAAPALTWGSLVDTDNPIGFLAELARLSNSLPTSYLLLQHIVVSIPLALLIMSAWWWYRSYALKMRAENEGEAYSDQRPVGWMDTIRAQRNTTALEDGSWAEKHDDEVAVGIGKYGEVASMDLDDLKKSILVVGTSRSGKTRQANSLAAQQVMKLGGGNICIDLKGDQEFARAKAELARQRGVPFLHFEMAPRSGGNYNKPHPYAPDWRAHYDPLQNGNGASKAAMLLNSVDRAGDAAVYARSAQEVVKLAFDIAALTGQDKRLDDYGHPLSGFAVLSQMLDTDTLISTGNSITPQLVMRANPFLSEQQAHTKTASIKERLKSMKVDLERTNTPLSGAVADVRSLVAQFVNDSAVGPYLSPGSRSVLRIDLVRAILRNEVVVFSLNSQEYKDMAPILTTMVLIDLQNAVSTLRNRYSVMTGDNGESLAWNPVVLQMEEISAITSDAAATAMLGLFNKSADVGIRPILSTQSLADIEAIDGTGVWLRQLTAQIDHLMTLQLSESHDAEKVAAFSGVVQKKISTEQKDVSSNRTGLFQGASVAGSIRASTEDRTRIGESEALQLRRVTADEPGELLWISKVPEFQAVHTNLPEGPNNWSERLKLVPLHEPPKDWKPENDPELVAESNNQRNEVFMQLRNDLKHDPILHQVISGAREREAVEVETEVEAQPQPLASRPDDDSELPAEALVDDANGEDIDSLGGFDDADSDALTGDFDDAPNPGEPAQRSNSRTPQPPAAASDLDDDSDPFA